MTTARSMSPAPALTRATLQQAVTVLCERDGDLCRVVDAHGAPPLWSRPASFATLVHLILEQQVSLASALAVFNRLKAAMPMTAAHVAGLEAEELRACGLTRQKAAYCIELARSLVSGELSLPAVRRSDDLTARKALVRVKGIGAWTADCYLLFCLRRPDIWPDGDLALAESARWLKRLNARPDVEHLRQIVASWSPWRSVGARILWHSYLAGNRGAAPRVSEKQ